MLFYNVKYHDDAHNNSMTNHHTTRASHSISQSFPNHNPYRPYQMPQFT